MNTRKIILLKEDILEAQSKTLSAAQAARLLGVSPQTYARRAKELGIYVSNQGLKGSSKPKNPNIDTRIYTCNDNIFSNKDMSAEKAYWLGFLLADGYISEKRNLICLVLKREDKNHLVKFKEFLNFTGPIIDRVRVLNEIEYPISEITIRSKQIVFDLVNLYHICQNKTYKSKDSFKYIPLEYKIYFYLGYFDGDGSIAKLEGRSSIASYNGEILQYFKEYLNVIYDIQTKVYRDEKKNCFVWTSENVLNTYKFIKLYVGYKNKIPLLERKYKIAMKYLKYNGYM